MTGNNTPALRIVARKHGFRRCGIAFPATGANFEAGRFTAEEVKALSEDPGLIVHVLDGDSPTAVGDSRRPRDAVAVLAAIAASFGELGPNDLAADGAPKAAAVSRAVGYDVSEAEVAFVWQQHQQSPVPAKPAPSAPDPSLGDAAGAGDGSVAADAKPKGKAAKG